MSGFPNDATGLFPPRPRLVASRPRWAVMADGDVSSIKTKVCPDCGTTLGIDERYVTWYDGCGWNLDPTGSQSNPKSSRHFTQAARAKQRGDALFQELSAKPLARPHMTAARLTSLVVAVLVHAFTVVLGFGIYVLVTGIARASSIVAGLLLILLSVLPLASGPCLEIQPAS